MEACILRLQIQILNIFQVLHKAKQIHLFEKYSKYFLKIDFPYQNFVRLHRKFLY